MIDGKNIIIPDSLSHGDTIGIVAPASPFDEQKLKEGIDIIQSMGFNIHVPEMLVKTRDYLSAPDADRARWINEYFADRHIKAIICARGGYGSIRVLSKLDYDLIRKNPKILMGFSDVTVLLTALYKKCHISVYHGPMIAGLPYADNVTRDVLKKALTFSDELKFSLDGCTILKTGKATAPVTGGNLTSLCHLVGTPYSMNGHGHILFLEERGEALYRIDRMLMHLKLAGCFDGIKGLILGTFEECGDYLDVVDLVAEFLNEMDIPVIAGFNAGHGKKNLVIPMGMPAWLDTDKGVLRFQR